MTTTAGVLKTHNIECNFWSDGKGKRVYHGSIAQDRWSDGQERFSLNLYKLRGHEGTVALYRGDERIADFETAGTRARFAWKGIAGENIPKFEIGEELSIRFGGQTITGIVEPD